MDDPIDFDDDVARIAVLGEPVRRALYRYVVQQPDSVSREEAADGVGVAVHVAKFHLDRLEEDGMLEAEYRRPPGRSGPGAGRPSKRYRRAQREISVSLPERRYDLAGAVMAAAIVASLDRGISLPEALREAARSAGRSLADRVREQAGNSPGEAQIFEAARATLDEFGYESMNESSRLILRNCPFDALAREYTQLVCGMNVDLVQGMLDELAVDGVEATLDPGPGRCCVTLVRRVR